MTSTTVTTSFTLFLAACAGALPPDAQPPASLTPAWAALRPGDTLRLTAPGTGPATWTTSDSTVAAVDQTGRVSARALGVAQITAHAGAHGALARVVVAPAVLVGAGDIAGCQHDRDSATARLLDSIPGIVFTAGDNVYPDGRAVDYANCYEPTWGRHHYRTRPAPGNHDVRTGRGAEYYRYFGAQAGERGLGYYSYDVAGWHVIALNSTTSLAPGSPQERWLRADLTLHPARCTVAYWHHSRFSSGHHGNDVYSAGAWAALYDAGAEIVINGHDHLYERFAPQTPAGAPDSARGIRQFIAGTGGSSAYTFRAAVQPSSEVRLSGVYGVLKLTLRDASYDWEFIATDGTVKDRGSDGCH